MNINNAEWKLKNPEQNKLINKNASQKHQLRYKYGMTTQEYARKLLSQKGLCAICKAAPNKRRLAVDHCHSSGKIRSLLCPNCNLSLGLLKENLTILKSMIQYIETHAKENLK